jgi:hypothetical protein
MITMMILIPMESIIDKSSETTNNLELKRESCWIVLLISTLKFYVLSIKNIDFLKKSLNKIMPFVVPFSTTANLAVEII